MSSLSLTTEELNARDGGEERRAVLYGHRRLILVTGLAAIVVAAFASLALGARSIPLGTTLDALFAYDRENAEHAIVRELRVPRTLIGIAVGAALGAAGALMQGLTRNALADPGIFGIEAGASLAVVIAIAFLGITAIEALSLFAIAGAGAAAVTVYAIAGRGSTPLRLALAGGTLAAVIASFIGAIVFLRPEAFLESFRFWLVGSIAGRPLEVLVQVAPFLLLGFVLAILAGKALNALNLGEDVAQSLGVEVERARLVVGVAVMCLAGSAVAAAGPIAFVGLIVPHIARMVVGPDYRWAIPISMVVGALVLLPADVAGRVLGGDAEIEVGLCTALLGTPFFIYLVRRRKLVEL